MKCPQFRNSAGAIPIHFFVVSAGNVAPVLNSRVSAKREVTVWGTSLLFILAPRGFSLGSPVFSSQKPTFLNSNWTWKVSPISALR